MATYYAKRALEILRDEGPVEFFKTSTSFVVRSTFSETTILKHSKLPDDIIFIDPGDVDFFLSSRPVESKKSTEIISGDWDCRVLDKNNYPIHSNLEEKSRIRREYRPSLVDIKNCDMWGSFYERYINDKPWKETGFYKELCSGTENSNKYGNSIRGIDKRFEYNDRLYNQIKKDGCQAHPEPHKNIQIFIGRDGKLIHGRKGTHRFIISKLLGVDRIPVWVRGKHADWQDLRDDIHNNGLSEEHKELRDHPDLQDIL